MPKVTVLMPVHNGGRFLARAISSVLAQSLRDFDFVIVDDRSTDDSEAIVGGFADRRIRYVRNDRNLGLAATLNVGLQHGTGDYVARLDQDDRAAPQRLAEQTALLDRRADVALVGSLARCIDQDDRVIGAVRRPISTLGIRWFCLLENPFIHSSVMFRRSIVETLGGYDERLTFAEDLDLWGRILESHEAVNMDRALVDYRMWPASMMSSVATDRSGQRQALLRQTMARLIQRHVRVELDQELSAEDALLLAGFTGGLTPGEVAAFLDMFDTLRARFESRRSVGGAATDYRQTVAAQIDAVAYRLQPASRAGALRVYARELRREPRLAAHVSWSRAAAIVTLGKSGRDRARSYWQSVL